MQPNVLIGTPAYDNQVAVEYLMSIVNLLGAGIDARFGIQFPTVSFLPFARNALASRVLNDRSFTHLLFVDADMGFRPSLVRKMLAFDHPFVGCIYPRRALDIAHIAQVARARPDLQGAQLRAAAMSWLGAPSGRSDEWRGDFVRAPGVGTGILLLKREVLETMRDAYPELWLERTNIHDFMGVPGPAFQCFTSVQQSNGVVLSEDASFCHRWTEGCGGEIWACITEEITHAGRHTFVASFADRLRVEGVEVETASR